MHPFLAVLPIIIAIVLILGARQSAANAGLALLGSTVFIAGLDPASPLDLALSLQVLWRAFAITLPITYILLGGVFL